jgi:hypothetical protein
MRKERIPTDGARALREWLASQGISLFAFCERHSLDRVNTQKAVNGERRRVSVDFALSIEKATGGAVPIELWASETMRPVQPASEAA